MSKGGRAVLAAGGVLSLALGATGAYYLGPSLLGVGDSDNVTKIPLEGVRIERSERSFPLSGAVTIDGHPLADATVTAGGQTFLTDETGAFSFDAVPLGAVTVTRPGYLPAEYVFDGSGDEVDIILEPRIVRGIRVSPETAKSDAMFQNLLDLAAETTVNAFVFDTKGDYDYAGAEGVVFYETEVELAQKPGLVVVWYDPVERIQQAEDAGLYTITRIPVFISQSFVNAYPQYKLVSRYLDPGVHESWNIALDLAVEACELGFDEIQFDYIRYPDGQAATLARNLGKVPGEETRVANISGFLEEAADRLHPIGCAVSANSFGWINSIDWDGGLGQRVEEFTAHLDGYVPMLYPDYWEPGSLGLSNPGAHPGTVIATVLDMVDSRVSPGAAMRPLLQGFSYTSGEILAQINEAEKRGCGWQIWNMDSVYSVESFPPAAADED
jgi:hypothetical protein